MIVQKRDMRHFIVMLLTVLGLIGPVRADQAADFSVATDKGKLTLVEQRGQVVYLDFWASWCVPCRKSFPWLNEMQARYGKVGLKVIAINLDEERKPAEDFLKNLPARFTIAYDPAGEVASRYGLQGMPSSYLIDRNGKLLFSHVGFRSEDKAVLEDKIRQALKN